MPNRKQMLVETDTSEGTGLAVEVVKVIKAPLCPWAIQNELLIPEALLTTCRIYSVTSLSPLGSSLYGSCEAGPVKGFFFFFYQEAMTSSIDFSVNAECQVCAHICCPGQCPDSMVVNQLWPGIRQNQDGRPQSDAITPQCLFFRPRVKPTLLTPT